MKRSNLYLKWIKYLKKKRLYGSYIIAYSVINEFLYTRQVLFNSNVPAIVKVLKPGKSSIMAFTGRDFVIPYDKDSMDIVSIIGRMYVIDSWLDELQYSKHHRWKELAVEFGKEVGILAKPTTTSSLIYGETYFLNTDGTYQASTMQGGTNYDALRERRNNYGEQVGQWYDRFYSGLQNRGARNRVVNYRYNNNNRWRR